MRRTDHHQKNQKIDINALRNVIIIHIGRQIQVTDEQQQYFTFVADCFIFSMLSFSNT